MRKSDLAEKIKKVVSLIPEGKVATYGQIAKVVGLEDARVVGFAIRGNKDPKIPCHRLVRADGSVPTSYSLGDWQEQVRQLKAEGVNFTSETKVDLEKYLWEVDK